MTFKLILSTFNNSPVTYILMVLLLIFMAASMLKEKTFLKLLLHPFSIFRNREYYRLLTSDLVHNDIGHFVLNEFMLYVFGTDLEEHLRKKSESGSWQFLFIYLFSLISANLLTSIRHRLDFNYSSAGASGSIMGCVFAFMIIDPNGTALNYAVIGPVRNIFTGFIYLVLLIIYKWKRGNDMINHELHFYGALSGVVATLILFPNIL